MFLFLLSAESFLSPETPWKGLAACVLLFNLESPRFLPGVGAEAESREISLLAIRNWFIKAILFQPGAFPRLSFSGRAVHQELQAGGYFLCFSCLPISFQGEGLCG